MSTYKYTATKEDEGMTIKAVVKRRFAFSSRLFVKIKNQELIYLNGKKSPGWIELKEGDEISISLPEEKSDFIPEDIPIDTAYEDEDILVINKRAGYAVHPTKGKPSGTIANGVMKKILDEGKSYKIRFVNRLDMNTSGLLIIAKNPHAQDNLAKQMTRNEVSKKYIAVVEGIVTGEGCINKPIGRPDSEEVERWILSEEKGGQASVTYYKAIDNFDYPHKMKWGEEEKPVDGYSLCELRLETGRTHQIRVHMASIGHPIAGDHLYCHGDPFEYRRVYGDNRPPLTGERAPRTEPNSEIVSDIIRRQALHAYSLEFSHPVTGEKMSFTAKMPEDMKNALNIIKHIVKQNQTE